MTTGYPGQNPQTAQPNQEDRIAAGIAHLGLFGGFWLVAPIAIYFWKGKTSRFVGFHAVQAGLLNVVAIPLAVLGCGLGFVAMIVFSLLANENRGSSSTVVFQVLGPTILVVGALLPSALVMVFAAFAGIQALQGREYAIPILGRLARSIVKEP